MELGAEDLRAVVGAQKRRICRADRLCRLAAAIAGLHRSESGLDLDDLARRARADVHERWPRLRVLETERPRSHDLPLGQDQLATALISHAVQLGCAACSTRLPPGRGPSGSSRRPGCGSAREHVNLRHMVGASSGSRRHRERHGVAVLGERRQLELHPSLGHPETKPTTLRTASSIAAGVASAGATVMTARPPAPRPPRLQESASRGLAFHQSSRSSRGHTSSICSALRTGLPPRRRDPT